MSSRLLISAGEADRPGLLPVVGDVAGSSCTGTTFRWPGLLLIGAAARDVGKTRLATALIRQLAAERPVLAAKVTVIRDEGQGGCARGGEGCGVCGSLAGAPYLLTEERGADPGKDTARLLAAGAARVFWLRVAERHLAEGRDALVAALGVDQPVVCESNTFRRVVEPDVFLVLRRAGVPWMKESCRAVLPLADGVVDSDDGRVGLVDGALRFVNGRWGLRRDATAVILAGGRSTRMGRDKALLELDGRPLIERLVRGLEPHFAEILISARQADAYAFLGCRVVADPVAGQGPMRGVATALAAASYERVFLAPCDQAEVPIDVAAHLFRRLGEADAAVLRHPDGHLEPLLAVLRRRLRPVLEHALSSGERRMTEAYARSRVQYVDLPANVDISNLNTPVDYLEALRRERRPFAVEDAGPARCTV